MQRQFVILLAIACFALVVIVTGGVRLRSFFVSFRVRNCEQNTRVMIISRYYDYLFSKIKVGDSKETVGHWLGEPQNEAGSSVWVWVDQYSETINATNRLSWQFLIAGRDGYCVVFKNNRVMLGLHPISAVDDLLREE